MNSEFLNSGFVFSHFAQVGAVPSYWVGWGKPVRASKPVFPTQASSAGGASSDASQHSGVWAYAPDFFLEDPEPWWWFPLSAHLQADELIAALCESLPSQDLILNWQKPAREGFSKVFQQIQTALREGSLEKAVPVVFEKSKGDFSSSHRAELLSNLLEAIGNYPLMIYGLWDATQGILGATPEVLFQSISDGCLESMALAGTRKKSAPHSLLLDPKELKEHRIVIEGLCQSFGGISEQIGAGVLEVGETTELELPTLVHLHTPVRWRPESIRAEGFGSSETFEILVGALHPTPALGAFPREAGMKWLKSQRIQKVDPEGGSLPLLDERGRFGAPFGLLLPSERNGLPSLFRCGVAIRNIQWNKGEVTLGAGCGIVSSSQEDSEWAELNAKIQSVKRLFGLSQ